VAANASLIVNTTGPQVAPVLSPPWRSNANGLPLHVLPACGDLGVFDPQKPRFPPPTGRKPIVARVPAWPARKRL